MKLSLLLAAVAALCVQADTTDHKYKKDEHIELWVNKVRFLSIVRSFCNDRRSLPSTICFFLEFSVSLLTPLFWSLILTLHSQPDHRTVSNVNGQPFSFHLVTSYAIMPSRFSVSTFSRILYLDSLLTYIELATTKQTKHTYTRLKKSLGWSLRKPTRSI